VVHAALPDGRFCYLGVQVLIATGVRAVVQPGGSVRDPEVTAAGILLYHIGTRDFAH
jgi:phosphoribosylaminoimidazolecarboxamide formyltransferase/IMP cyclohydrolase